MTPLTIISRNDNKEITLTSLFIDIFHNLYLYLWLLLLRTDKRQGFLCIRQGCVLSPMLYVLVINFAGRPKLRSYYEKIKQPVLDSESMGRGPNSFVSVTQTRDSRLPSVDNKWRKWRTSLILEASSQWRHNQLIKLQIGTENSGDMNYIAQVQAQV